MKNTWCWLAALLCSATLAPAMEDISAARILERTKVLASDELEGRAPGSAGEDKTVAYLIAEFKKIGLQPGNPDGSYIQAVPMVGITSKAAATFTVGGQVITPTLVNDYVALSRRLAPTVEVKDAGVVFVGYGVAAPEFGWDDFKGVDVRGKTVLVLIGDPPVTDPATGQLDPKVFGGKAMTYYGRWTYKYEMASARGAAACLIIHETGPAGYPFAVPVASSRESFDLDTPDKNAGRVAVEGWLTLDTAKQLLAAAGQDFGALKAAAARRDFHPVPLAARASFTVTNTTRAVASRNVIGLLPGADEKHRGEYLVYSAHWDAYGRNPNLTGDQILNGAADNATAVGMLLEIAQAAATLPADRRAPRSLLFFCPTAEEKGLVGSRYYAEHPLYPLTQTLADINLEPLDANSAYGPTRDIEVVGSNASTLDDLGAAVAAEQGRVIRADTDSEKGYYYRSDHFEFAKVGVPAYFTRSGLDFIGQPEGYGLKLREAYLANDYHKVTDEVRPDWTMLGAAQNATFLLEVGLRAARAPDWPAWKPGTEFKARREAMLQK
jgi:Zn-dependent M28 family amino/carboxypeptidase